MPKGLKYLVTGGQGKVFHVVDPSGTARNASKVASIPDDAPVSYCRRQGTLAKLPEGAKVCGKCIEQPAEHSVRRGERAPRLPKQSWPPPRAPYASLASWAEAYRHHLLSENKAPNTVDNYMGALEALDRFLIDNGEIPNLAVVTKRHVQQMMTEILSRTGPGGKPRPGNAGTAINRFKALRAFFNWVVDVEEELDRSPMHKMRPPVATAAPVPIVNDADLEALLKACKGKDFAALRDTAMFRLFRECGVRRDEMLGMTVERLDLDAAVIFVVGKGSRMRGVPFGHRTATALTRYLRVRGAHLSADLPELWLTNRGAMGETGLRSMLERRCREAGIGHLHPHMFRHTFAHDFRRAGGDDDSLMRLAGWKSRDMLARYGASVGDERAADVARRLKLGDRF